MTQPARKPLSKRVRFEVFKRDSFKCQYCGAKVPDEGVFLHVDHIKPIADGGTDDITNLITACSACNLGKAAVPLSDSTAVSKARAQLEQLQERREQLEMMVEWQRGLVDIETDAVESIAAIWSQLNPDSEVNADGQRMIRKWLKRFSAEQIVTAMRGATESYGPDGFDKVPSVAGFNQKCAEKPYLRHIHYCRGILRRRLGPCRDDYLAIEWMTESHTVYEVTLEDLKTICTTLESWQHLRGALGAANKQSLDRMAARCEDDDDEVDLEPEPPEEEPERVRDWSKEFALWQEQNEGLMLEDISMRAPLNPESGFHELPYAASRSLVPAGEILSKMEGPWHS